MTISELRQKCKSVGLDMEELSFSAQEPIVTEVGLCIHPKNGMYEVFAVERNERVWSGGVHDEAKACDIMLREIRRCYPRIKI